jgi:hypothetical protein
MECIFQNMRLICIPYIFLLVAHGAYKCACR